MSFKYQYCTFYFRLTSSTKKKTPAKTPAKTSPATKPRPQLETVAEEKVVQEPALRSIRKPVFRPKVLTGTMSTDNLKHPKFKEYGFLVMLVHQYLNFKV